MVWYCAWTLSTGLERKRPGLPCEKENDSCEWVLHQAIPGCLFHVKNSRECFFMHYIKGELR